jgi:hypothetical protein
MIDLDKMIDPGQDSDLCGRSLEFAPSSALLRRASTYLAVAPDLPLWLPMPAKDVEPLVCLGCQHIPLFRALPLSKNFWTLDNMSVNHINL